MGKFLEQKVFWMRKPEQVEITFGIYACSPEQSSFKARFSRISASACGRLMCEGPVKKPKVGLMLLTLSGYPSQVLPGLGFSLHKNICPMRGRCRSSDVSIHRAASVGGWIVS